MNVTADALPGVGGPGRPLVASGSLAAGSPAVESVADPDEPRLAPGEWVEGHGRYVFTAAAGRHVLLQLESPDPDIGLDPDLSLALAGPDNTPVEASGMPLQDGRAFLVATLPAPGTYSVEVTGHAPGSEASGTPRLRLDFLSDLHTHRDRLSHQNMDDDGMIAHDYAWDARPGASLTAWLTAEFDAYLELYDPLGELVATDDDSGGDTHSLLDWTATQTGTYRVRVTSAAGDETGAYTLHVWSIGESAASTGAFTEPQRVDVRPEALTPLPVGVWVRQSRRFAETAEFYLPPPLEETEYDLFLLSEADYDLYATILGEVGPGTAVDAASEEHAGFERLHLRVPGGSEGVHVRVVPYEQSPPRPDFHLLVQEADPLADGDVGPRVAGPGAGLFPYGGELAPGVRRQARIDGEHFTTQFWTVRVPEGTQSLSIGLFGSAADFDLSVEPGWAPQPAGFSHQYYAATKRHNERMTIGDAGEAIAPGLYTVAVWTVDERGGAYEIEARFDAELPPSVAPLAPGDMPAPRTPGELVSRATVLIENDLNEGMGALVTPDGLVLTNYHVISDCHPGPDMPYGCQAGTDVPWHARTEHLISVFDARSGRFVQRFVAELLVALPEHDLALMRIREDIDGRPVGELRVPFLPVAVGDWAREAGRRMIVAGKDANVTAVVEGGTRVAGRTLLVHLSSPITDPGSPVARAADGALVALGSRRHYPGTGEEVIGVARPVDLLTDELLEIIEARGGAVWRQEGL